MTAGLEDVTEALASPGTFWAAMWASAWIARRTIVPAWATDELAVALVLAPVLALVVIARRVDALELTGGRCRAANVTNDRRCANSRDAGADLCGTHQNTHGVKLHPTAVDGADNGGTSGAAAESGE
ncbi:hypothetical protein [Halosimplex amylolyticum]|uniref:hypothetical protein n=1 Tax=Halosimplex amylolyticum TaxID=3396616 RepID=UPI003F561120